MSFDDLRTVMEGMGATEAANRVAAGIEQQNAVNLYTETTVGPIVIYRGSRDIGKNEKKPAQTTADIAPEYIGNVDEYSYENLARDLKYNDKNDNDICTLNGRIGKNGIALNTALVNKKMASYVYNAVSYSNRKSGTCRLIRTDPYIESDTKQLWADMRLLGVLAKAGEFYDFIRGENVMMRCFWEMCKRFEEGTGETWEHRNGPLYDAIKEHRTTNRFVKQCMFLFLRKLFSKEINGVLEKLQFKTEWRGQYDKNNPDYGVFENRTTSELTDEEIKNYNTYELLQQTGKHPVYDDFTDKFLGLGITIHDIWAMKVQIEDLVVLKSQRDGIIGCKGHFVVMIYDNFGLDDKDIQQSPADILFPFWGWYILQHHTKFNGKYKPFINQIILKYDMSDYINSPVFSNHWKLNDGFIKEW